MSTEGSQITAAETVPHVPRAIDAFGVHLRDDVDLPAVRGRLVVAAATAVQPDGAAVWIRGQAR